MIEDKLVLTDDQIEVMDFHIEEIALAKTLVNYAAQQLEVAQKKLWDAVREIYPDEFKEYHYNSEKKELRITGFRE